MRSIVFEPGLEEILPTTLPPGALYRLSSCPAFVVVECTKILVSDDGVSHNFTLRVPVGLHEMKTYQKYGGVHGTKHMNIRSPGVALSIATTVHKFLGMEAEVVIVDLATPVDSIHKKQATFSSFWVAVTRTRIDCNPAPGAGLYILPVDDMEDFEYLTKLKKPPDVCAFYKCLKKKRNGVGYSLDVGRAKELMLQDQQIAYEVLADVTDLNRVNYRLLLTLCRQLRIHVARTIEKKQLYMISRLREHHVLALAPSTSVSKKKKKKRKVAAVGGGILRSLF